MLASGIKPGSIRRIDIDTPIPDGTHRGVWSGYRVEFATPQGVFEATTEQGVRGLKVPCLVEVQGGVATLKAMK
jgi:hypothetical protein